MRALWEIAQPFGLRCRTDNWIRKRSSYPVGFSREESNAVHGTGCAGVRG